MSNSQSHSYHGITDRQDIREELLNRLGYLINPALYAISFIQNAQACYLRGVTKMVALDSRTADKDESIRVLRRN